jgi:hypothetical protein
VIIEPEPPTIEETLEDAITEGEADWDFDFNDVEETEIEEIEDLDELPELPEEPEFEEVEEPEFEEVEEIEEEPVIDDEELEEPEEPEPAETIEDLFTEEELAELDEGEITILEELIAEDLDDEIIEELEEIFDEEITEEEIEALTENEDFDELPSEAKEQVVQALNADLIPDSVREEFEENVNVFSSDDYANYVQVGSRITVEDRKTIIVVTAATTAIVQLRPTATTATAGPSTSSRRTSRD